TPQPSPTATSSKSPSPPASSSDLSCPSPVLGGMDVELTRVALSHQIAEFYDLRLGRKATFRHEVRQTGHDVKEQHLVRLSDLDQPGPLDFRLSKRRSHLDSGFGKRIVSRAQRSGVSSQLGPHRKIGSRCDRTADTNGEEHTA